MAAMVGSHRQMVNGDGGDNHNHNINDNGNSLADLDLPTSYNPSSTITITNANNANNNTVVTIPSSTVTVSSLASLQQSGHMNGHGHGYVSGLQHHPQFHSHPHHQHQHHQHQHQLQLQLQQQQSVQTSPAHEPQGKRPKYDNNDHYHHANHHHANAIATADRMYCSYCTAATHLYYFVFRLIQIHHSYAILSPAAAAAAGRRFIRCHLLQQHSSQSLSICMVVLCDDTEKRIVYDENHMVSRPAKPTGGPSNPDGNGNGISSSRHTVPLPLPSSLSSSSSSSSSSRSMANGLTRHDSSIVLEPVTPSPAPSPLVQALLAGTTSMIHICLLIDWQLCQACASMMK
jgi:ribosomal protein S8